MRQAIAELLSSKKFLVGISSTGTAILVRLSVRWNLGIDEQTAREIMLSILALAGTYLAAQGAADFGKEKK